MCRYPKLGKLLPKLGSMCEKEKKIQIYLGRGWDMQER